MESLRLKLVKIGAVGTLAVAFALSNSAGSLAGGRSLTCTGGSIPAGTYSSVTVTGACTVDAGKVVVEGRLMVAKKAELIAAFGGSNLKVRGNLQVNKGAILVLGCEPGAFSCLNDDPKNPTMSTKDLIGGNLNENYALSAIVHRVHIGQSLFQLNGGGGVNCKPLAALHGSPAYATYEDVSIAGDVTIASWRSCWLGLFRTVVGGSVTFVNNIVADPDGNEVATNTIGGNLVCSGSTPAPQVGDSGGSPNVVAGLALGQCKHLAG